MDIFDIIFDAGMAFNQAGFLIGALFCGVLGALMLYAMLRDRMRWLRVTGEVVGVREKGKTYHPVFRFMLPDGTLHEATAGGGSASVKGLETGAQVPILVDPKDPTNIDRADGFVFEAVAVVLLATGLWFGYIALTAWPFTWMTGGMLAALAIFGALRFKKNIIPKDKRLSLADWKAARREKRLGAEAAKPILRAELVQQEQNVQNHAAARWAAPLCIFIGLGLAWGTMHTGQKTAALVNDGLRAEGRVIAQKSSSTDDGVIYHSVVRYRTAAGENIRFTSSGGASAPLDDVGAVVTVMYLAAAPEESAKIDRGVWNWAVPGGLGLFALFMIWAGLHLTLVNVRGR